RRHTRWPRDWSSDVCSSDLRMTRPARLRTEKQAAHLQWHLRRAAEYRHRPMQLVRQVPRRRIAQTQWLEAAALLSLSLRLRLGKIGRASCRERVWVAEGGVV